MNFDEMLNSIRLEKKVPQLNTKKMNFEVKRVCYVHLLMEL